LSSPSSPIGRTPNKASAPAWVLRLFKGLDPARAEAGSGPSRRDGALNYKSIASILAHKLDQRSGQPENTAVIDHPNVRGPGYFH
jgi:hypothetical protein